MSMRVAYHVPDDGGSTHYRASLPLSTCRRRLALDARPVTRGEDLDRAAEIVGGADVIMVNRMSDVHFPEILSYYHSKGKRVVLDWDDDVFSVSPMSNFYQNLGTENVRANVGGQMVNLWKDGEKGFCIADNRARVDSIKRICERVDMITVTTDRLAGVYRQFNDNVRVLPNCIDLNVWQKLPLAHRTDVIRMGWFGGSSHFEDWVMLAQVLPEIMFKYPQLRLVIMGQAFSGTLKDISPAQIELHPWVHTQAYPYKAAILDLDFAVIPLKNEEFNWGKSPIKFIEMAALRVPAVISHVTPYAEIMDLTPDNGIFIADNDPDAWESAIKLMIENPAVRAKIADQAYRSVVGNFDIEQQFPLWVNAYKEVMACPSRPTQLSTK